MGDEPINVGINSLDGATATKHALQKTTQAFAAQIFPSVSFELIIKHLEHLNTICLVLDYGPVQPDETRLGFR